MHNIYQINRPNPSKFGKRMRYLYGFVAIPVIPLIGIAVVSVYNAFDLRPSFLGVTLLAVYTSIYFLYRKFRRNLEHIKKIGFLEIHSKGININIGSYSRIIKFKEIENIRIEKFFSPVKPSDLWNTDTCYLLFISHGEAEEKLIVDDISMKSRKISIVKTLDFLSKKQVIKLESDI